MESITHIIHTDDKNSLSILTIVNSYYHYLDDRHYENIILINLDSESKNERDSELLNIVNCDETISYYKSRNTKELISTKILQEISRTNVEEDKLDLEEEYKLHKELECSLLVNGDYVILDARKISYTLLSNLYLNHKSNISILVKMINLNDTNIFYHSIMYLINTFTLDNIVNFVLRLNNQKMKELNLLTLLLKKYYMKVKYQDRYILDKSLIILENKEVDYDYMNKIKDDVDKIKDDGVDGVDGVDVNKDEELIDVVQSIYFTVTLSGDEYFIAVNSNQCIIGYDKLLYRMKDDIIYDRMNISDIKKQGKITIEFCGNNVDKYFYDDRFHKMILRLVDDKYETIIIKFNNNNIVFVNDLKIIFSTN